MKPIDIPVVVEPGSQPPDEDGVTLDYMRMPSGVWTYAMPSVPEPEETAGAESALALAAEIHNALTAWRAGDPPVTFPLDELDPHNLDVLDQLLQSGEVSVRFEGDVHARIQESALAGVWRIQYVDGDRVQREFVEIGAVPSLVADATFRGARDLAPPDAASIPENVGNGAALLTEIADKQPGHRSGDPPHAINLSLMPNTDEDMAFLVDALGSGPMVILSRGYGNCRITSTATRNVWWVQYFNSQDTLILNTIEISAVPEVACAAPEDIADSAERLGEILEVYR